MKTLFLFLIILFLISCSKSKDEQRLEAIDLAQTYLSNQKCVDAINVLEDAGMDRSDPIYLQVLASAYSCKAGFSELNFISKDIPNLDTSDIKLLFKSLSLLSLSDETETDSDNYLALKSALSILTSSTGDTSGHDARVSKYGSRKAGDMGVQVMFLSLVGLGKFLNYFGNVNDSGAKGVGGDGTNSCFIDYSDSTAQALVDGFPVSNTCSSHTDGHSDLDLSTDEGKVRACEGLIFFNNILDSISNLDLSASDSLGGLGDISGVVEEIKSTVVTAYPNVSELMEAQDFSTCIDLLDSAEQLDHIEIIYALIFEENLE